MAILISLIEDDRIMRNYLSEIIKSSNFCKLVGIASNGREAKELIDKNEAEVYLVDLGLPDIDGLDLISLIAGKCPNAKSLVISTFGDYKHISMSIRAGASGYLLKEDFGAGLIEKIVDLQNGAAPLSPSLVTHLFKKVAESVDVPIKETDANNFVRFSLAQRENEVLNKLIKGHAIYNIADDLCITVHTVNQHLRSIYRKLNVHSRSMAVYVAINNGFKEF